MTAYFVTGTDTGIGKTWVTVGLMAALRKLPAKVVGMKPVASGCTNTNAGLRSEDALLIQAQCDIEASYEQINPYAFEPPVAPHAAAAKAGVSIDLKRITSRYEGLFALADAIVVEGVGGWRVPLGDSLALKDVARALRTPVILVVGLRLGCINHALLTAEAIGNDGIPLAAWVANQVEPGYPMSGGTMNFLKANISAPMIGFVPFMGRCAPEKIAACLDLGLLNG